MLPGHSPDILKDSPTKQACSGLAHREQNSWPSVYPEGTTWHDLCFFFSMGQKTDSMDNRAEGITGTA